MLYSVDCAHILWFCCRSRGLAEDMVVVVVMMMMTTTMMSSRRRRRGYLRTVTFQTVYKTPHLLLYSSISVHCHTVNSLFRLPHSMLKVLYRNLPACHFIMRRNSNCCEAQNLSFCLCMSMISAACCLTVPLSHNGFLTEFCI
jgi:uncharacterized membrane protein SirB2